MSFMVGGRFSSAFFKAIFIWAIFYFLYWKNKKRDQEKVYFFLLLSVAVFINMMSLLLM